MKKNIEAEISFAEMVDALKNTKGEVRSPINLFDCNTLFSTERYNEITRMVSSICSLKRDESIDLCQHSGNRSGIISSLSISNLWFSLPIAVASETKMSQVFFQTALPSIWNKIEKFTVETKQHGGFDKLPAIRFFMARDEMEVGIMKDRECYSLYACKNATISQELASSFTSLADMQNFISMLEKIFSPENAILTDEYQENAEKRLRYIERANATISFHLDNIQKTKIAAMNLEKGNTNLFFP